MEPLFPGVPRVPAHWSPALQQAINDAAQRERDYMAHLATQLETTTESRASIEEWGHCG